MAAASSPFLLDARAPLLKGAALISRVGDIVTFTLHAHHSFGSSSLSTRSGLGRRVENGISFWSGSVDGRRARLILDVVHCFDPGWPGACCVKSITPQRGQALVYRAREGVGEPASVTSLRRLVALKGFEIIEDRYGIPYRSASDPQSL